MSKTNDVQGKEIKWYGWGNALLVQETSMPRLVASLLTYIESLGFPENQERAMKEIIKRECWSSLDSAWIIGDEQHYLLKKKAYEFGQLSVGGYSPQDPECPTHTGSTANIPQV